MLTCSDCYFLHNVATFGRQPHSCEQLGEQAENAACGSFCPRGQTPDLRLSPTEPQLSPDKPIDFEYATEFRRLYGEQLQIERDLYETTKKLQTELKLDQSNCVLDSALPRYVQKLADLRLLHLLCGLFECGLYRDDIMAAEVERLFGVKPSPATAASTRSARSQHAGVLQLSDESSGTSVGGAAGGHAPDAAQPNTVSTLDTSG